MDLNPNNTGPQKIKYSLADNVPDVIAEVGEDWDV